MRRKLTVKLCRDVKPDPARRVTDVGAKGLGLRVSPNGHKVLVLQYRRGRQVRSSPWESSATSPSSRPASLSPATGAT